MILNLAPVCQVDSELLAAVDVLVVNEIEGAAVAGIPYSGDNLDEIIERLQHTESETSSLRQAVPVLIF